MRGLHRTLWLAMVATSSGCDGSAQDTDTDSVASDANGASGDSFDLGICARYIECVAATDEIVPGLQGTFGETGTCWSEFDATICWDTCQQELASLRELHPSQLACTECQTDADCSWLAGSCNDANVCVGGVDTSTPSFNACSLTTVAPGLPNPIVAGDEAGLIPSSVGEALERNCGCHYTSAVSDPYLAFQGGTQLQTLANFRNAYNGANSLYVGMAAYKVVFDRVVRLRDMPMALCETDEGAPMTAADLALFTAWLDQDAPDGATFSPP